jgi:hypothetical protein
VAKKRQIGAFTGDLGRLLAEAKDRAEGWISQRESIGKELEQIRDSASALLVQLGNVASNGHGRSRGIGRPRKRRKLSAAGRAAIVAAQKARWARVRAAAKK